MSDLNSIAAWHADGAEPSPEIVAPMKDAALQLLRAYAFADLSSRLALFTQEKSRGHVDYTARRVALRQCLDDLERK